MLYGIFRLLICVVILSSVLLVLKKTNKLKKKHIIIFVISFFSILSLMNYFPFENLFFTFKTPENAFNYSNTGEIEQIIEGKHSCMVSYETGPASYSMIMIPKTENGYKIPSNFIYKTIYTKFTGSKVDIYKVNNSNDYYVTTLCFMKNDKVEVYDSNGSEFKSIVKYPDSQEAQYLRHIAFVDDLPDDYYVNVNGDEFHINE